MNKMCKGRTSLREKVSEYSEDAQQQLGAVTRSVWRRVQEACNQIKPQHSDNRGRMGGRRMESNSMGGGR